MENVLPIPSLTEDILWCPWGRDAHRSVRAYYLELRWAHSSSPGGRYTSLLLYCWQCLLALSWTPMLSWPIAGVCTKVPFVHPHYEAEIVFASRSQCSTFNFAPFTYHQIDNTPPQTCNKPNQNTSGPLGWLGTICLRPQTGQTKVGRFTCYGTATCFHGNRKGNDLFVASDSNFGFEKFGFGFSKKKKSWSTHLFLSCAL